MRELERAVACHGGLTYRFRPREAALLIIDMQRDFLDPLGFCAGLGEDVGPLRAIIPALARVLDAARRAGLTVIHTREGYAPDLSDVHALKAERGGIGRPGPLGRGLIRGQAGHEIIAELRPRADEPVIDKPGFGAFYKTDLEAVLRAGAISHLLICGVTSQCCVQSTLREAVDRGFYCLTLADGCAAYDPALHRATLEVIQGEGQLFGWIAAAEAVLEALAR